MPYPLVSVVTVVRNACSSGRAELLKQSLDSVAKQDYPHIEHLVIDGASTDGTMDLLRPYEDSGRIVLVSEPDSGIYDAMNKGIAKVRGKYVAFLNSDDYWKDPRGVSSSVDLLESTGAAFSYAPSIWLGENDGYLATNIPQIGAFYVMMPFCHQTMFTRADKLREYGGFDDKTFRSVADYDLICRMLMAGERPVYNPLNFTVFRMGGFNNANEEQNRLREHENRVMRQRVFGGLMPPEQLAELSTQAPLSSIFTKALEMQVHPSVALQMERCIKHEDLLRDTFGLVANVYKDEALAGSVPEAIEGGDYIETKPVVRTTKVLLFGFLPVLILRTAPSRVVVKLFGLLPLLKVRKAETRRSYLLFGCIPVLTVRSKK